ncbi:tissue factor pathway inhibitor 2-like isoform X2 [Antedon mediterranea]|uniref:tissue factor pathway inhibitor 2-like isoform X2 n=1 Tax=Antedon mediterranea TaxID=105859 RepID=UPI003AF93310
MKTSCSIFFVTLFVTCVVGGAFVSGATDNEDTVCELPKDHGNGQYTYSRWYYNNDTMTCKELRYSGCGGNGNRFVSREECSTTCNGRCYQPVPDSHDKSDDPHCDGGVFEWYYHTDRGVCLPFRTSLCPITNTGNRFPTKRECKQDCIAYHVFNVQSSCSHQETKPTCTHPFILSGKVSLIHHEIYSEYLVHRLEVEVVKVYKGRDLLNIDTETKSIEIRIILTGQNCHNVAEGSTYIFMGYLQHRHAIINDTSYVKPDTQKRRLKIIHYLGSCPSNSNV